MDVKTHKKSILEEFEIIDLVARFLNPRWLTIVLACLWVHIQELCVLGFCVTDAIVQFRPSIASTVFTLAVASLTAEYKLYPTCSLRLPHPIVLLLFDVLFSLLISNATLLVVWIPLSRISVNVSCMLASYLEDLSCYHLGYLVNVTLDTSACALREFGGSIVGFLFACAIYALVLYATDSLHFMRETYRGWSKARRLAGGGGGNKCCS